MCAKCNCDIFQTYTYQISLKVFLFSFKANSPMFHRSILIISFIGFVLYRLNSIFVTLPIAIISLMSTTMTSCQGSALKLSSGHLTAPPVRAAWLINSVSSMHRPEPETRELTPDSIKCPIIKNSFQFQRRTWLHKRKQKMWHMKETLERYNIVNNYVQ